MCDFKRSPSKVWWASESLEWREISKSPGSQDSGFSDTETSPTFQAKNPPSKTNVVQTRTPPPSVDIFKPSPLPEKPQNLSTNFKEKTTPDKNIPPQLDSSSSSSPKTSRFTKNSPKVSRSLFKTRHNNNHSINQYSKCVIQEPTHSSSSITSSEIPLLVDSYSTTQISSQTLPNVNAKDQRNHQHYFLNSSAPAVLEEVHDDEDLDSLNDTHNSLASDSESDLECLFDSPLNSPQHTSTPKASLKHIMHKLPLNLLLIKQQQERRNVREVVQEQSNVNQWMAEIKQSCDPECMTTLQAKSIAGELNHKVSQMASQASATIQSILKQSACIETEYKTLNNESKHVGALAQSLAGNIVNYLERHTAHLDRKIMQLHDEIRKSKTDQIGLKRALSLFDYWQFIHAELLLEEVKNLINKLEHPRSELDLRSTITAVTCISLRNDSIVELFTKNDAIPILLTLCDKCEGSSLRSLLLRALTIMCSNAFSVRQLEKYCGIQTIADTLEDESRPEPERSEAVALLAQVTAPWIEDNHYIRGLQDHSRKLVRSLTKLVQTTKCCQNLLLCAAALANLTTMDAKCVRHMVGARTCGVVLDAVRGRGPCASVYLREQVATLLANVAASEAARKQLGEMAAARVLLCFLSCGGAGSDVEKRVQQKSIIALSRLCSDGGAAAQVVEAGGVEKLVKMCREKDERFDNDAVLVATLATLRKIADACGSGVIRMEDAQELVEPKLLDSFLAYSTQSESYV